MTKRAFLPSYSRRGPTALVVGLFTLFALLAVSPITAQDRGLQVQAKQFVGDDNFDVGKQYAVIIGIDKYREWTGLGNAVSEAKAVKKVLAERYYIDEFFELYDEQATAANIRQLFGDKLPAKIGLKDSLLVFYAGHGYLDASKTGFWIACDGVKNVWDQSGWLPNSQLRNLIGNLKSQRTLVLADACFAGDFLNIHRGETPTVDNAYFRKALKLIARQALTSGASETVPDQSEFGRKLVSLLERNDDPYLDTVSIYERLRQGITKTQPLMGTLPDNEPGASFVLFLKPATAVSAPTVVPDGGSMGVSNGTSSIPSGAAVSNGTAELYVTSNPSDAELYIDGVLVGRTGNLIPKVAAGKPLAIEARKGNQVARTTLSLTRGELKDLNLTLAALKGNLILKAPGAEECRLSVAGRDLGPLGGGLFRDLEAGDWPAVLRGDGLYWTGTISVLPEKTNQITTAPWEVGVLDITVPTDAQLRVLKNGVLAYSRSGSARIEDVPTGLYTLEASGPGYETVSGPVTVTRGVESRGQPWTTGNLTISTEPSRALVYVGGNFVGQSPVTVRNLASGGVTVSVKLDGYTEASAPATIAVGKTAALSLVLSAAPKVKSGMVLVTGGTFTMGSTNGDSDEKPTHNVTVSSFYLGAYEVTQDEYQRVMGTNPSAFRGDGKRPVEKVSWYDAVAYCNALSKLEGFNPAYTINGTTVTLNSGANGYRLPTEAEWEYAARGGTQSKGYEFPGSADINAVSWYTSNSGGQTKPVGTKAANELGIYDMAGNVWEWCWDWCGSYSGGSQTDPIGSSSGSLRVLRGGSWYDSTANLRSVARSGIGPTALGSYSGGFRVLLPMSGSK